MKAKKAFSMLLLLTLVLSMTAIMPTKADQPPPWTLEARKYFEHYMGCVMLAMFMPGFVVQAYVPPGIDFPVWAGGTGLPLPDGPIYQVMAEANASATDGVVDLWDLRWLLAVDFGPWYGPPGGTIWQNVSAALPAIYAAEAGCGWPYKGTIVYVEPYKFNGSQQAVDTTFDIDVDIFNASTTYGQGLWSFSFQLWFDNTLLNATNITPGDAVTGHPGYPGSWFQSTYIINNAVSPGWGYVSYGGTFTALPLMDIPGNATLATITFKKLYQPTFPATNIHSTLVLNSTLLGTAGGAPIQPFNEVDGKYILTSTPPQPPVASFTENATVAVVGDPIGFDASGSSDPDGFIVSYNWTFGDGSGLNTTGTTASHAYAAAGVYTVNLTVFDNDGQADWTTSVKTIVPPPTGPSIDVYTGHDRDWPQPDWTPFIGLLEDQPADAFFVGEMVELCADVVYNLAPEAHILVAFEIVYDMANATGNYEIIAVRTAETDKNGTACVDFRIPIRNPMDLLFGTWTVKVTAKVKGVLIIDHVMFKVGYIAEIENAETSLGIVPTSTFVRGVDTITINVIVKSIALISKPVTLVATAYDEGDVPIGISIVEDWTTPESPWCNPGYEPVLLEIFVPDWANVGPDGYLTISILTRLPSDGGVPYAPEVVLPLIIDFVP